MLISSKEDIKIDWGLIMELLAPAGNIEGFKKVLAQKPDVIYLGAGELNARSSEAQFQLEEVGNLVDQAKKQGVKIYFTLNVLLRDDELDQAVAMAKLAQDAGVAALIVQDKGLMVRLKEELPDLSLHASTQCSVGTKEQILELKHLGIERIVLARELSLEQIADLTTYAHSLGIETEVFTHGATCMSVSGQCHMSAWLGGRSANRGECAQPCRQVYELYRNGELERDFAAYLSPKDLSYFPYLRKLREIGVNALKIEGRLRSPEYQSQVTATFKTAMEEVQAGLTDQAIFTPERERNLQIAFNRGGGYQASFLTNKKDKSFLSPDQVGHQGYYLGRVSEVQAFKGVLAYVPKDNSYLPEPGSQISLKNKSGKTVATAPVGVVNLSKKGHVILQGFHPQILKDLHLPLEVWQQKQDAVPEEAIREKALANKEKLYLTLRQEEANYILGLISREKSLSFSSAEMSEPPVDTGSPLAEERLSQQLAKLGNTPYELGSLDILTEDLPAWRISDINRLRREALEKFEASPASKATYSYQGPIDKKISQTKYRQLVNLPFYQAGMDLSQVAWQPDQLVILPLEELYLDFLKDESLYKLRKNLAQAGLAAYIPLLSAWSLEGSYKEAITSLAQSGLKALVSSTSGISELVDELGLTDQLELYLWQGGQVWNSEAYKYLSSRGYHGLMLSPELSLGDQEGLANKHMDLQTRPIVFSYGPLESMFTRFCSIGYSLGKSGCRLCRDNTYALVDDRQRVFPLTPKRHADCSLQIWQSEIMTNHSKGGWIRAYNFVEESFEEIGQILQADGGY